MPEYLAPGVYVEETSFRAKSIEGVGTSTTASSAPPKGTAFHNAARCQRQRACIASCSRLRDFERMTAGSRILPSAQPSAGRDNFLAHSFSSFLTKEARASTSLASPTSYLASTANLRDGQPATRPFLSGPPSAAAAETVERLLPRSLRPRPTPNWIPRLTVRFLRISDPTAAPATLEGGTLPANLSGLGGDANDRIVLNLTVNNPPRALGFAGQRAILTATADLTDDPVIVAADAREFRVRVNGLLQVVQLPAATPRRFAAALELCSMALPWTSTQTGCADHRASRTSATSRC